MLEYDRIDISEEIDVNKTSLSKECDIWHYWYFKDIDFKYEKYLCNGSHDLMQKAMSFNNVAVVYVKGSAYRIHFWYMSKDDVINIMNGSNLGHKKVFQKFFLFFLLYIKDEWGYWYNRGQVDLFVRSLRAVLVYKLLYKNNS